MSIAVRHFEAGENYFEYQQVLQEWPASRLMLDSVIDIAKSEGLMQQDGDLDLRLTEKGKHYALKRDLHK